MMHFLMDDASTSNSDHAKTLVALQEIRDLLVALLKSAYDALIPADHAPSAAFWAPYKDEERKIGL